MTYIFLSVLGLLAVVGYAMGNQSAIAASATPAVPAPTPKATPTSVSFGYASDGTLTGSPITNDPSTWPGSDAIYNICAAVALAEGYNQGKGTAPYDLNNPGDLSPGDEAGYPTCGTPQNHGGSAIIFFCTVEDGFLALHQKFANIVNGASSVYGADWTWAQVAAVYAGDSAAWLNNVTSYLGVDPQSTPAQYVQNAIV
jgi:hypothetical protein